MPLHYNLIIQGINLLGVDSGIISFIQGSQLDHQRYLAIWAREGYDVRNPDFLRWLFGVRGNNTQRAGALTVDMLNGHELILMESSVWKTASIGQGGVPSGASEYGMGGTSGVPLTIPAISPIIWIIIASIAAFMAKKK